MNFLLILLIFLAGALVWLLGAFLFRPIGKLYGKLVGNAKKAMFEDEKNNEKEDKDRE